MNPKFQALTVDTLATTGITPSQLYGPALSLTFSRSQLLVLQFTKLLNYFTDDLMPEWGGDFFLDPDAKRLDACLDRFLKDTMAYDSEVKERWIHKKFDPLPWGPDNFRLKNEPSLDLGAPYEAYMSVNGALLTINQASRILGVDPAAMVKVKLRLLYDERVIAESVRQLLRPRPEWPKYEAKQGSKGQTIRVR